MLSRLRPLSAPVSKEIGAEVPTEVGGLQLDAAAKQYSMRCHLHCSGLGSAIPNKALCCRSDTARNCSGIKVPD